MALGAVMVWASASEDSGLGTFLTIFGWGILGISALLFVLFPGVYRAIANPFMPSVHERVFLVALRRAGRHPRRRADNLFRRAGALTRRSP